MSSIPVRRTTRVVRSTKDNENVNARTSRIATTRAKSVLGAGTTASSVTTRATASTAASKAKTVNNDGGKDEKETGIKRKREVLVEVTGLVTNNKTKSVAPVAKGKEVATTDKPKDASTAKPKATMKPPTRRLAGPAAAKRLVARAPSESTTVLKADSEEVVMVQSKPAIAPVPEQMQVDLKADDEDANRVFKRRHTNEKPTVVVTKSLDDSQAEADVVASELQKVEPSETSVQLWDDLDEADWDDPVMVSEYVADVCVYLKEIELSTLPNPNYMDNQNEITWHHRGVLIDWLLQVHARFNLQAESLFLCVNILDRFLGARPIALSKLQLAGLTCFFIATKYEETYAPSVKEIAFLSENQYTAEEVLVAERYILRILEWDLRAPGPMGWLRRASKADDCEVHARTIGKYLLEIGCVERRLMGIVPSLMAASAIWLARLALGREVWTPNLEHYTTYSEQELLPVANIMLEYILTNPIQHESLFKKYAHKRYFRCSAYMQQWSLERWPENGDVKLKKDLAFIKEEISHHRQLSESRWASRDQEGTEGADNA